MVSELESNPNIFVILSEIAPAIPKAEVESIFDEFQLPTDSVIGTFAEAANGISLWWIHTKNPKFDRKKFESARNAYKAKKSPPADFSVEWSDGLISIGELGYMLDPVYSSALFEEPGKAKGRLLMGKQLFPQDTKGLLRNFDEYSDTSEHVVVHLGTTEPAFVFLPTDEHQDFESSRLVTLESYLEFLIWSKGLKNARYEFFIQEQSHPQQIELLDRAYFAALPQIDIDNLY